MRRAWEKVAGMEEKAVKMEEKAVEMEKVAEQGSVILKQKEELAGMQRRADALTRVFTWSTDSEWSEGESDSYTFTGGVDGHCFSRLINDDDDVDDDPAGDETYFIGFDLEEGPDCALHFKCSILDKNDKVLRVVSGRHHCDFRKPPTATVKVEQTMGAGFCLTEADKAGAVRADGSIKLCMVVHLCLPWV